MTGQPAASADLLSHPDLASGWTPTGTAATSEDAASPVPTGRTLPIAGVPRGEHAPSGHGRVHASGLLSNDRRPRRRVTSCRRSGSDR